MKQASTLLLLCLALTSTASATAHKQAVKHQREFSSPTAVPRVAKRQDTLAQLQQALDQFLATANGTSTSSHLTAVPTSDPTVQEAESATDDKPSTSRKATSEANAQTSDPASIDVGASQDAPSSSSTTTPPRTTSTDTSVVTSSSSTEVSSSQATDDPVTFKTSTTSDVGLGGALSSILVGDPSTTSTAEPTTTTTKAKPTDLQPTDTGISISVHDPETKTTSKKPDDPQTTADPATTTSAKPIEISIGLPDPETTTTRKVDTSSTPDGIGITISDPLPETTTTRRDPPTTTSTAVEISITLGPDPETSSTTTTTKRQPDTTTTTTTSKGDDGISISIDLPTIIPSSRPQTTKDQPTSTKDEPQPPQSTDEVSITIGLSSTDPKPSRSTTRESSSPTQADPSTDDPQPSHTTSHGGISISIGLPSVIGNVTDIIPSSRPGPTGRPSSDVPSSTKEPQTSFTDIIPTSRPAAGGNQTTDDTQPSSGTSTRVPVASSSRGAVGGNVTEPAGASASQSGDAALPTGAVGNNTAPVSSSHASESSSEIDTSTKTPNSFYNFVPTSTLMVNTDSQATTTTPPTSATGPILTGNSAADESISSITLATSLPSSLPAKIVPGNAPASIPDDSTLVSLMFEQTSMGWLWVVQSPDTAAQVLAYMPQLLASSLNVSETDIQSTALVAYQSLTDTSAKQLMTVYLATLPSDQVANLQAQVKTPSSLLYQQNAAILQQLSQQLVATFPVTAFTSTEQATIGVNGDGNGSSGGSDKKKNNTTVIAVVASFGSVIVLLLAFVAFRYVRRNKNSAPNLRALQLGRSATSSPISSPQMQQAPAHRNVFSGLFTSHHYASSPESRRSYGSDSSGHSSAHSIGGNNREVQRGISWYSGRYTDFGDDHDNGSPRSRSVYGQAITQDANSPANPFGDRHASGDSDEAAWLTRSEGVRRLKTGQVQISRPQLEGNSLML